MLEANATIQTNRRGREHGRGRGRGCGYFYGQGRGRSRGRHISWNQGDYNQPHNKKNNSNNQKLNHSEILPGKATKPHNKMIYETECYRCGMKGHWSFTCPTTKHLIDLYQASIKGKSNQIETNFVNGQGIMDHNDPYQVFIQEATNQIDDNFIDNDYAIPLTYFDISDFFEDPSGKIDHLISDALCAMINIYAYYVTFYYIFNTN